MRVQLGLQHMMAATAISAYLQQENIIWQWLHCNAQMKEQSTHEMHRCNAPALPQPLPLPWPWLGHSHYKLWQQWNSLHVRMPQTMAACSRNATWRACYACDAVSDSHGKLRV
jgi:hypothetical protein